MVALLAGCAFDTITVPQGDERPVVHAVLNPWAPEQIVLVERTLTGRTNVDEDQTFNRNDPIVTGAGVPLRFATVVLANQFGDSIVAIEDATLRTDLRGAGVYRFRNPASPEPPGNTGLPALAIRPGETYDLLIVTPAGDTVRGRTTVPQVQAVPPAGGARLFNRDTDTLRFFWDAVPLAKRYLIRVDSPWGPMYLFTDELEARIPGSLRNVFQENIPRVFLPGFRSTVSLAAVDVNYFDYFRSANDPFTGSGLINRLEGAVGVFGSMSELFSYRLLVTANVDHPLEGSYSRSTAGAPSIAPTGLFMYVESEAEEATFVTGQYAGNVDFPSSSFVGLVQGDKFGIALMRFENDVSDTVGTFVGDVVGDSLIGILRIPGRFTDVVRYGKGSGTQAVSGQVLRGLEGSRRRRAR